MSVVKTAMLLLLLAIGATQIHGGCDDVKMVAKKDLDQINGRWVLVWAVADHQQGSFLMSQVLSSYVELHVLPDNHTIKFDERNLVLDKSCINFYINMSVSDNQNYTMQLTSAIMENNGVFSPYNESGVADFYESFKDCLILIYTTPEGRFLFNYRRWGHHHDLATMKANRHHHEKNADCLGFPHDRPFIYDGAADFCHKNPTPEVKVNATPGHVNATLGDVNATPGHVNATPGDVNATPGDVNATPGDVNATLGDVNATQGDVNATQVDVNATQGDVNATQGDVNATPGHVNPTQVDVVEAKVEPTHAPDH